jgi:hypothetical protein
MNTNFSILFHEFLLYYSKENMKKIRLMANNVLFWLLNQMYLFLFLFKIRNNLLLFNNLYFHLIFLYLLFQKIWFWLDFLLYFMYNRLVWNFHSLLNNGLEEHIVHFNILHPCLWILSISWLICESIISVNLSSTKRMIL